MRKPSRTFESGLRFTEASEALKITGNRLNPDFSKKGGHEWQGHNFRFYHDGLPG
jgi:hypothetical protein